LDADSQGKAVPMNNLRWYLLGSLSSVVLALLAGVLVLTQSHGFSAREQPSSIEKAMAQMARSQALPADVLAKKNPVVLTPEALAEGRAHWADHCASCHGNDGSGETEMGQHLYPPAPDMKLAETQQKSDGELFYVIENGIRMTGMPAWGAPGQEDATWKLVHFIRHLPKLTLQEKQEMEKLNPKGPDDRKEEEEEEKFLKGESSDAPAHHHH
jgi:mono/diheme cytochrome c family protein